MHSVPRSGSGMNTISKACEASALSSHLQVPSAERCTEMISGARTSALSARRARKSFARSVIAANEPTPRLYTQFISWRARNGLLSRVATNCSSAGRGRPKRFVRSLTAVSIAGCVTLAARVQLRSAEEITDLACRGVGCVRAMHDVLLDAGGEIGANGAGGCLLRIGRAHDLAIACDRVLAFEHLHDHRS